MDESYFAKNFNTPLTPEQEGDYKLWLADQMARRGRDLSKDETSYDMRGYFAAGKDLDSAEGHFPDTFKKPNHPTFSDGSQYHGAPRQEGGKWQGGTWGEDNTYTPHPQMFQYKTHDPRMMQRYFQKFEPGIRLNLPK